MKQSLKRCGSFMASLKKPVKKAKPRRKGGKK